MHLGSDPLDAMLRLDHPRKTWSTEWANEHLGAAKEASRDVWLAAGEAGFHGLLVESAHGGVGASAVDVMLTLEGLGMSDLDNGVAFALASQAVTINRALSESGSDHQRDRWLRPLVRGEIFGAFAMTEPDAGSAPWSIGTTATLQEDGSYVLNGTKSWTTLGPVCDVALIFATTDPALGRWGITAFLVDAQAEGFSRGEAVPKVGLAGCPWGQISLHNVVVDADQVLGAVGAGAAIFSNIVEAERAFLYAPLVGASERTIERCVDYARGRRQGDTHIGAHQAVSHRIVDMKLHHEMARTLLYKAAAIADRDEPLSLPAALAKLAATDLGPAVALDAFRTFGAAGFAEASGIGIDLGDAIGGLSFSATADIARNIVASELRIDRPTKPVD